MNEVVIQKAAALLAQQCPDADQSIALSGAVGLALGMCATLDGLGSPEFAAMSRTELLSAINNKQSVYHAISVCNECCLLCVDTAVRCFTKAYVARIGTAQGNVEALGYFNELDPATLAAAQVLRGELSALVA